MRSDGAGRMLSVISSLAAMAPARAAAMPARSGGPSAFTWASFRGASAAFHLGRLPSTAPHRLSATCLGMFAHKDACRHGSVWAAPGAPSLPLHGRSGLFPSMQMPSAAAAKASCRIRPLHTTSFRTRLPSALRCGSPRCLSSASLNEPRRVVFLGTPDVAARSLELLIDASRAGEGGGFEIAAVVSQPAKKSGRKMKLTPSPVSQLATEQGLKLLTPPNAKNEEFLSELEALDPDLCITAAYGCFLPRRFLDLPKKGTLNIHPSLLPLYRGAAPLQRCLEAGDEVSGVSVLFTVLKMDAGPILRQQRRPLDGSEQAPELLLELFERGTRLLVESLPSVWDGSCDSALTPQEEASVTKADKIAAEEAQADLARHSARTLHNRVRAFTPWPGVWTLVAVDGKEPMRMKLLLTRVAADAGAEPTRELRKEDKALRMVCADGSVLHVLRLTLPGKKPIDGISFINGLDGRKAVWLEAETPSDE